MLLLSLLLGCREDARPPTVTNPNPRTDRYRFPDPDDGPGWRGPGGPAAGFDADALWTPCAWLDGGPEDDLHHNLVMPYRGHLVMPWAPEWSGGGVSLFDVSDPCAPAKVGEGTSTTMRETHAIGFVHLPEGDPHAGDWAVVNALKGIQVWDLADPAAPALASELELPDIFYPDAYARVVLSVFVQYPWVYVAAADNGLFTVDMTEPLAPALVSQTTFDVPLRAGGVFVTGNTMLVSTAEQTHAMSLDVSDPAAPTPVADGYFETADASGTPVETYHGNVAGNWAMFARKEGGGGPIVYDVGDPSAPVFVGDSPNEGNGGYVFYDEGFLFVGESSFASVHDFRDPANPVEVGRATIPGDLDTAVPYGNVMVLSVDDEAEDHATAMVPWTEAVDVAPPQVLRVDPPDGATGVRTTARVGVGFSEPVEAATTFAGSIRLYRDQEAVEGWVSVQENIASFVPKAPLTPGATYRVQVLAGGVTDLNGNVVDVDLETSFTVEGG